MKIKTTKNIVVVVVFLLISFYLLKARDNESPRSPLIEPAHIVRR